MLGVPGLLLFVVFSAGAVAASLHAWRTQQVYGWCRFFAFEALGLLIVWNVRRWFDEPLSVQQLVSWTLLAASVALAAHAFYLLAAVGKAQARVMEDTQRVVEVGAYRYIRHPAHASLMLLGWGIFCKGLELPSLALASLTTGFLIATSRCEERFNLERFGTAYSEYIKRTRMFIPFVL
jgi:protein-S-isoprenylcysteine O-methyltransferase Ste14